MFKFKISLLLLLYLSLATANGEVAGCKCNEIGALSTLCDANNGTACECKENVMGQLCDKCASGTYDFSPNGCKACNCNFDGAADNNCNVETGQCQCKPNITGVHCNTCREGNWDFPKCAACECNGRADNCNELTGDCEGCQEGIMGKHCDKCIGGFYGDAMSGKCESCNCNVLGTNGTTICDPKTGQCNCRKNVVGRMCDSCDVDHWKIASGQGCEPCHCNSVGSDSAECNEFDGTCLCKKGYDGAKCDECAANFWGDPLIKCEICVCSPEGSTSQQCYRTNGACVCKDGIGGRSCDACGRGLLGDLGNCTACGECFNNWDPLLDAMHGDVKNVIDKLVAINKVGGLDLYKDKFHDVDQKVEQIQELLSNDLAKDIIELSVNDPLDVFNATLIKSESDLLESEVLFNEVELKTELGQKTLQDLTNESGELLNKTNAFIATTNQFKETKLDGALELTRDARQRVAAQASAIKQNDELHRNALQHCEKSNVLLNNTNEFNDQFSETDISDYNKQILEISAQLPSINDAVCDGHGDPCDSTCGGIGCHHCGGIACSGGAVSKSKAAYNYVQNAANILNGGNEKADELSAALAAIKVDGNNATRRMEKSNAQIGAFLNDINNIMDMNTAKNSEMAKMIAERAPLFTNLTEMPAFNKTMQLQATDPVEVAQLAERIGAVVAALENVEATLEGTKDDLLLVERLKERAIKAKVRAHDNLVATKNILKDLDIANKTQLIAIAAVESASVAIELAKVNLKEIRNNTIEAQPNATEATINLEKLSLKLGELQKGFYKNDQAVKEIALQSDHNDENAKQIESLNKQLLEASVQTNVSFTTRNELLQAIQSRAQALLERAAKLASETEEGLKQIADVSMSIVEIDEMQPKLQKQLDELYQRADGYYEVLHKAHQNFILNSCI